MKIASGIALGAGLLLGAVHLVQKLVGPYAFKLQADDATMVLVAAIACAVIARREG